MGFAVSITFLENKNYLNRLLSQIVPRGLIVSSRQLSITWVFNYPVEHAIASLIDRSSTSFIYLAMKALVNCQSQASSSKEIETQATDTFR